MPAKKRKIKRTSKKTAIAQVKPQPVYIPILWVLGSIALGSVGSLATMPAIPGWYANLAKPELAPPNWVFGPVWIVLFALMGFSAYLVYRSRGNPRASRDALEIFAFQFVLNVLWSFLFFGLRSPLYGVMGIVSLWIAILGTLLMFFRVNRIAAFLLVPYLLWVTFAGVLNVSIYLLN